MGYPSYARYHACALSSPSLFHYVMAKIVPLLQLAAHAKCSTLCGRSYGVKSRFFWLDDLLQFQAAINRDYAMENNLHRNQYQSCIAFLTRTKLVYSANYDVIIIIIMVY